MKLLVTDEWWLWFSQYAETVDRKLEHHTKEEMTDYEKGYMQALVDLVEAIEANVKEK